jgi:mono/diheme cytochrome c family protein
MGQRSWWCRMMVASATMGIAVGCSTIPLSGPSAPSPMPAPLPTLDSGQIARGRQVYVQNCARCHGQNAEGAPNWQQPDARGNLPPPPHDDTGHTWRHSDAQLTEIIQNGLRDRFNKTPELTMPPFKGQLTDEEIASVMSYFKSLWSLEHRMYQDEQNQRPPAPTQGSGL